MTQHDFVVTLRQMLDHAEDALAAGRGKTGAEIESDFWRRLAVPRAMQTMGEAANRLPQEVRDRHPEMPWRDLIALRNVLVHQYDVLNYEILATIIADELPALIARLKLIIQEESS